MNCPLCGGQLISDGYGDYIHKQSNRYACADGRIPQSSDEE